MADILSERGLVLASGHPGNGAAEVQPELYPFSEHGGRRIDERKHALQPYIMPPSEFQRFSESTRQTLVDWMVQRHLILENDDDTEMLHLALRYVDTFLALRGTESFLSEGAAGSAGSAGADSYSGSPPCNKLKRLGITCLFIAAKMTFCQPYSTPLEFVLYSQVKSFTRRQLFLAEKSLLRVLEYYLYPPTPSSFSGAYLSVTMRCLPETLVSVRPEAFDDPADEIKHIVDYLLEVSVLAQRSLEFAPSLLAAAAIWYTLSSVYCVPWDQLRPLHAMTGYSQAALRQCSFFLDKVVADAHVTSLQNAGQTWVNVKYQRATGILF